MKKCRLKFNLVMIALTVIFIAIVLIGNVFHASVKVATLPGTYADQYAEQNSLKKVELTDNEKQYFDLWYEEFDYNVTDKGTIVIEKYKGTSSSLVIPESTDGRLVTALGEKFFELAPCVKDIYIPTNLAEIKAVPTKDVTIHCYNNSEFTKLNEGKESEWNIKVMYDSDFVNFKLDEIPFRYNDNGGAIELVGYMGKGDKLVIPSHINGKPVTTISFDMLGKYNIIVFPNTVAVINGRTSITMVSNVWKSAVGAVIVALIATLIMMNVVIPRFSSSDEIILSTPTVIVTFIYLIAQIIYSLFSIYKGMGGVAQIVIITLVMLAIYVLLSAITSSGRNQILIAEAKIEEKASKMRDLKAMAVGLSNGIEDSEIKKVVMRIEEEIKYMPLDKDKNYLISEVENLLIMLKRDIVDGKKEEIFAGCKDISDLLKQL